MMFGSSVGSAPLRIFTSSTWPSGLTQTFSIAQSTIPALARAGGSLARYWSSWGLMASWPLATLGGRNLGAVGGGASPTPPSTPPATPPSTPPSTPSSGSSSGLGCSLGWMIWLGLGWTMSLGITLVLVTLFFFAGGGGGGGGAAAAMKVTCTFGGDSTSTCQNE